MARPGPANSQRARHSADFLRRPQQDFKLNKSRRLMVTVLSRLQSAPRIAATSSLCDCPD
jgi:hypothetical protein